MLSQLEAPAKPVLQTMTYVSFLFALTALAAGIAWIYYVAKAVEDENIGGSDGGASTIDTARVMFQGAVVSILFYFVFRHHFRSHY